MFFVLPTEDNLDVLHVKHPRCLMHYLTVHLYDLPYLMSCDGFEGQEGDFQFANIFPFILFHQLFESKITQGHLYVAYPSSTMVRLASAGLFPRVTYTIFNWFLFFIIHWSGMLNHPATFDPCLRTPRQIRQIALAELSPPELWALACDWGTSKSGCALQRFHLNKDLLSVVGCVWYWPFAKHRGS